MAPAQPRPRHDGTCGRPSVRAIEADFFEVLRDGRCPDADVLLVDIDHSPDNLLSPGHSAFYQESGLRTAASALSDHGVFALWSDDAPAQWMLDRLRAAFARARAEIVEFDNPITGGTSSCTVYVASLPLGRT